MRLDEELKVLLEAKENFLLDLKLDVYSYTDANEVLEKKMKGANLQMVESMKQIQSQSIEPRTSRGSGMRLQILSTWWIL